MIKDNNTAIPSELNLVLFRNIEETAQGKEESMLALIATLRCLLAVVI